MLTILEAIQLSTDYLSKKGVESARANAELLLADILNCDRLKLYLSFDRPLSEMETGRYRELLLRRGRFEPLQYITGKVDFYGREFIIKPNVLIPRPETEFLIESALAKFEKESPIKILDIGCGSGIIPITLAKNYVNAGIIAVDINSAALECAKENSARHEVDANIKFEKMDILSEEADEKLGGFDLIISNPPYVSVDEYDALQKEITDYEPKEAVTDFSDGFTFYKRIAALASEKLSDGGWLIFEMGKGQSEKIESIFKDHSFAEVEIIKDLQKIDRIIGGKKK